MKYIISLGGSLINPGTPDVAFLKKFRKVILGFAKEGHKFLIVTGGGKVTRQYQNAAQKVTKVSDEALDWMGIITCGLNAYLLHAIFGQKAHPKILFLQDRVGRIERSIVVASGGLRPGGSSDTTSIVFARKFGAKVIVNLTNVSAVYDRDPKKLKNAKPIWSMPWSQFRRQFGSKRRPGQNLPFDPSGAKLAQKLGLKVVILNGRKLQSFQNFLRGRPFKGTVIM